MTPEQIRQRFCQDITAFNKGEIDAIILYEKAVRLGEENMLDNAIEQFEKELRQFKNMLNVVKDGAGELISVSDSLTQFKKTLTEE